MQTVQTVARLVIELILRLECPDLARETFRLMINDRMKRLAEILFQLDEACQYIKPHQGIAPGSAKV